MHGRSGIAQLPLHGGRAPAWLFTRMVQLVREISIHVVSEYGPDEMLRRLSALKGLPALTMPGQQGGDRSLGTRQGAKRLVRFGEERVRARMTQERAGHGDDGHEDR